MGFFASIFTKPYGGVTNDGLYKPGPPDRDKTWLRG